MSADPDQLKAAVTTAKAAGANQVLLLVCEQTYAQEFARDHDIATWATTDALFVNKVDGSVFLGHGEVDAGGRLRSPTPSWARCISTCPMAVARWSSPERRR